MKSLEMRTKSPISPPKILGGRFGYFFFFLLGGGEGGVGGARRGVGFGFLAKITGGGSPRREEGGLRGWEVVCGEFGGGGLNIFFLGAEMPTKNRKMSS